MKKTLALVALSGLLLGACAADGHGHRGQHNHNHHGHNHSHHGHGHNHAHGHHHGHQHGQQAAATQQTPARQQFECRNGMTVTVIQNSDERVTLTTNTGTGTAHLTLSPSGSGERYASAQGFYNKPTEWHVKNRDAMFSFTDPYNNKVETSCTAK